MRISFLLSSLSLSGGVQVVAEYANRLAQRGHSVALVAPGGTLSPAMLKELGSAVVVRTSRVERHQGPSAPSRKNLAHLVCLTWSLARAVPPSDVILTTHTPTTVPGLLAARLWRRGQLLWLYQDYREMFVGRAYEAWLLRHALRWHQGALTVSEYCRQELGSYVSGRIIVVGEGLSHPELFCPQPTGGWTESATAPEDKTQTAPQKILYVGDDRPRKGMVEFLRAAERVHERLSCTRLQIVCKYQCEIKSRVPFELVHHPTRAQLMQLYAQCDLFVSSSWREGFGLPPLEAMACGAPVVLTDSGGVREYARDGENCLMVPTRDPAALAAAMYRLLTDRALAERLRHNGPKTARRFTWESAVDRFEQALECLLVAPNE
jgi:glycosyltransferase involved in cell wall biosynthesis